MKRVKVFLGLIGITFFVGVLLFYYKTDVPLESSYLQGNIWGSREQDGEILSLFTNSCSGLHVELRSLNGQVNETRKKLEETVIKATTVGENISALQKIQDEIQARIGNIKAEKGIKESLARKTQYTLNTIERLNQEQKIQEDLWNRGNNDLEKKKAELIQIQTSLGELREEVATFEKQIRVVEQGMTKCSPDDTVEKNI